MENVLLKSLILKFRNQDMNAFAMIYDEFKRLIYKYAGKLCDDDAVQELTLFLIELLYSIDLSKFKGKNDDGLKRYIAVSLKHKYITVSKENDNYKKLCDRSEIYDNSFSDTLENLSAKEALKCLSHKQKIIIIYKYFYCLSDSEIAGITGISRQAVNRLKNRALLLLKEYYSDC